MRRVLRSRGYPYISSDRLPTAVAYLLQGHRSSPLRRAERTLSKNGLVSGLRRDDNDPVKQRNLEMKNLFGFRFLSGREIECFEEGRPGPDRSSSPFRVSRRQHRGDGKREAKQKQ